MSKVIRQLLCLVGSNLLNQTSSGKKHMYLSSHLTQDTFPCLSCTFVSLFFKVFTP